VPSEDTQRIQETQIVVLHVLCELVEDRLFSRDVEVVPARAGAADAERGAAEREAG
jgi:hypothetical protein